MGTAVFGAPEFKARSGRTVRMLENGDVAFDHSNGYLAASVVFDAEEYFQAKRDADLGRWRWPENPHYVVYPNANDGQVVVVDERDGVRAHYSRSLCATTAPPRIDGIHAAAHAYFEAHPERKPWEDAEAVVWDNGASLPQIAQRDLSALDRGWWWCDEPDGPIWRSTDELAIVIGAAEVRALASKDAS